MTFLNMIEVTFYDKYDLVIERETYTHSFSTAATFVIKEAAYIWARRRQEELNASYYLVGNGLSGTLDSREERVT